MKPPLLSAPPALTTPNESSIAKSIKRVARAAIPAALAVGGFAIAVNTAQTASAANRAEPNLPDAFGLVRIAHLAPFSSTITGTSVTVAVNNIPILTNFTYGQETGLYIPVPANAPFNVSIFPTGSPTAAISATLAVSANVKYTLAAIGNGDQQPLELLTLVDDISPAASKAKVRLIHTAPFTSAIPGTAVDIRTEGGNLITGNLVYKGNTGYLELNPAKYDLKVTTPGGTVTAVDVPPFDAQAGDVLDVFVIGDSANQALSVLPLGDFRPTTITLGVARVFIAHLAPFSSTLAGTAVSITLQTDYTTTTPLTDFKFGNTSGGYLSATAGTPTTVFITPKGSASPVFSKTLTLADGMDYTFAAIGDGAKQPLDLLTLIDDNTPLFGTAKLRVVHAAPVSGTITGTLVDIRYGAAGVLTTNFAYKANTGYVPLSPGVYDFRATAPGGSPTLVTVPSYKALAGDVVTLFAIGDAANQPLSALPVGDFRSPNPARIYLVHAASFAKTITATSVSVLINNSPVITNFTYGQTSGAYIPVTAGIPLNIQVVPTGITTPAIQSTLTLSEGVNYTLAAIGNGTKQPLSILPLIDDITPISGTAKVRIVHAAPLSNTIPGTLVDVRFEDGSPITVNLPYRGDTGYLSLPGGQYDLKVTLPSSGTTVIDIPPVTFPTNRVETIFAVGDVDNQPLGYLRAITSFGGLRYYMPIIMQNAPA